MVDNLNNLVLQDPPNNVIDTAAVQPYPALHVPMLNFVRPNQQNASRTIVKPNITYQRKWNDQCRTHVNFRVKHMKPPQKHLLEFNELSGNFHYQNLFDGYMELTLFLFLLIGEANQWLQNKLVGSITFFMLCLKSSSIGSSHLEEKKSSEARFINLFKKVQNFFPKLGRDMRDT